MRGSFFRSSRVSFKSWDTAPVTSSIDGPVLAEADAAADLGDGAGAWAIAEGERIDAAKRAIAKDCMRSVQRFKPNPQPG